MNEEWIGKIYSVAGTAALIAAKQDVKLESYDVVPAGPAIVVEVHRPFSHYRLV